MHGFISAPKRVPAQHLAEGGLVRGLVRRVMGIPEPVDVGAPAPAVAPAPVAAPAPAPAPERALTQYAGMSATERRMKAAGLKDGGPVRGPGTGTSDSIETEARPGSYIMPADSTEQIGEDGVAALGFSPAKVPVNLSNGEYQLPPEQVHAVGVQALDAIKDATHAPADASGGFRPGDEDQELFFADGGLVDDESRRRATGAPRGGTDVSASIPAPLPMLTASMAPSPQALPAPAAVPAPRAETNPLAQTQGAAFGVFRREPTAGTRGGMMQPYVATGPATFEPAKVQDGPGRLDAFNDPRSLLYKGDAAASTAPTSRGFAGVGEGWGHGGAGSAATAVPVAAGARPATPAPVAAPADAPAPGAADGQVGTAAAQVMPGVFRQGNSYGDSPAAAAAGFAPRSGPSAQNLAAADALEARGIAERAGERAAGAGIAAGFQPGGVAVIADGDAGRRDARNASVGSTNFGLPGRGDAAIGAVRALRGEREDRADAREQVRIGAQSRESAARDAAALQREMVQQAGATGRTLTSEVGANARASATNDVQRGELALRQESQGFQTRAARRAEDLFSQYEKAKPEDRAAIAEQIRTVTGKEHPNRFTVVAGGQEVDPTTQQLTTRPARVFNNQTGQFVDQAQPARAGLPPGMTKQVGTSGGKPVYEDAQGKRFVGG
ncbi:hypothetical protein ABL840_26655 [Variovorax sp. NFACC27]|uniref:hypothetical protein n=1 Tax=unclassified Variovorax TaxID=663243 RepID=UPI00089D8C4C|nr:hypothetical protein SAMN03159371_03718 [Variovorax sp. NFACC28]SEG78299.1 hypothetical protein SAMN03159365_03797 [Variovorax sp. NFACC29]SFC95442.1 hypothetical protein SAMN03159379_03627 [Variovorax sp. NFACC26]SFG08652.1 hypothetical protein SAMN03159447_01735 [Variovorax sp. NFACC27]